MEPHAAELEAFGRAAREMGADALARVSVRPSSPLPIVIIYQQVINLGPRVVMTNTSVLNTLISVYV